MSNINLNSNNQDALKEYMEAAQQARQRALAKKEEADNIKSEAITNQENAQKNKDTADAAAEKETNDVSLAEQNVTELDNTLRGLNTQYSTLQRTLSLLDPEKNADMCENIESQLQALSQEINDTLQDLQKAKSDLEKEKKEAIEADKLALEAEQALIEADNKLSQATEEVTKAEEEVSKADTEYETAKEQYEKAVEEADKTAETEDTKASDADFVPMTEAEAISAGYTVIKSKEDLLKLGEDLSGKYILMGDIDLEGIDWQPIGNADSPFKGEFNGNGFSISNLTINTDEPDVENIGFFGVAENAVISNLDIVNAKVITQNNFDEGSGSVGILVGTARGTEFDNITISGDVVGFESVGGLAGTIDDNNYYDEAGELVEVRNSSINNVHTSVNAESSYYAGGLVGYVKDTSTIEGVAQRFLTISNCTTSGNISISEESAGGLIGEAGKTIITVENCNSNAVLNWENAEDDSDISFLMETGRIGGVIGCANGTYLTIVGSEYNGQINAEGDFQGKDYGWYMNDAQISIYDIPEGLPLDDILKIDGVDALTPTYTDGLPNYNVTVSTLTGLDKMVSMIQANPSLADIMTFNVNFDFEAMDGKYDPTVYAQYGIVQNLYQDDEGVIHNEVYIDNEIDLETTYHECDVDYGSTATNCESLNRTIVSGLYKREDGGYYVITSDGDKDISLKTNSEGQETRIHKRLTTSEVKYREQLNSMVQYYQNKMHESIKEMFGIDKDDSIKKINKAEYKKLIKKAQKLGGINKLSLNDQAALAVYQIDYTIMNKMSETTHNFGCGMGGEASFLEKTKTYQIYAEDGRALYTTGSGESLVQKLDEEGNLLLDEFGDPVYEYADGSGDYMGISDIYEQRGYQTQDENGNLMFSDKDGNDITKVTNDDGSVNYLDKDGNTLDVKEETDEDGNVTCSYIDADGNEQVLEIKITPYNNAEETEKLKGEMDSLLEDIENGKYPLDEEI